VQQPVVAQPVEWGEVLQAFLTAKLNRSGSQATVREYRRIVAEFFGPLGKHPPAITSAEVEAYVNGVGASGKQPSAATRSLRLSALSSFYRYLLARGLVSANPCDAVARPRVEPPVARGLTAEEVRRLLDACPLSPAGRRDRALILCFVLTARRRSEILSLTVGDLSRSNGAILYDYVGKGGVRRRRELPAICFQAITEALAASGRDLAEMLPHESLWQPPVSAAGFYDGFRRHLRVAGLDPMPLHALRHTAAKLRRDTGQSVESVSSFLDHSSLAVTTTYLRRLEGEADEGWRAVAALLT